MRNLLVLCVLLFSIQQSSAQGGIQFMAGLVQLENQDANITPEGSSHNGYLLGADIALNDGKMFLIVGGQYQNISFMFQEESSYFGHDNSMTWFKLRAGLGFELFRIGDLVNIHSKLLGSINMLADYPEDLLAVPYGKFNSGTAGLSASLGAEIFNFGVTLEYEKGFFNAVNQMPGTEFNALSLALSYRL